MQNDFNAETQRRKEESMKHLDLFSGIGGFALAARWAGLQTIGFSEVEPYCCKLLDKNFKGIKNYGDIKNINGRTISADIISGGFPCQPFSVAGEQRGTEDDRYIWPEMLRVISEVKPSWIIGENVAGIINMALDQVLSDLESQGYETIPFVIPACAVNANHRRDRVWIVAHARCRDAQGTEIRGEFERQISESENASLFERPIGVDSKGISSDTKSKRVERGFIQDGRERTQSYDEQFVRLRESWEWNWFKVATELCGVDDGVSVKLDGFKLSKTKHRECRLKGLGNAIVPQVVYEIFKAIIQVERSINGR